MNLFHSCQKVAELLSQALDEPLSLTDRVNLQIHLAMCGNCRNVQEQMALLHALGPELGMQDLEDDIEHGPQFGQTHDH